MLFWKSLKRSVYDPAFYQEISGQSFSQRFSFFVKYILLLSVMVSVFLIGSFEFFLFGGKFEYLVNEVKSFYPDELVITVEKGVVSINQEQPYAVPLAGLEDRNGEDLDYAVIIDTQYPITLEALQEYKTLALVGERSVGFRNDNGGLEIYEIPKEMSVVISRSWVEEKVDLLVELFKKYGFVLALILLPIGVFSGLLFGVMVYLLFVAIIVWFVARIKGMPYSYSQSYVASMHLVMLPQALSTLLFWVVSGIPFFRTILLVILAIINLKNPQQQPTLDSQRQGLTNDPQQNTAENGEQKTDNPSVGLPQGGAGQIASINSGQAGEVKDAEIEVK